MRRIDFLRRPPTARENTAGTAGSPPRAPSVPIAPGAKPMIDASAGDEPVRGENTPSTACRAGRRCHTGITSCSAAPPEPREEEQQQVADDSTPGAVAMR